MYARKIAENNPKFQYDLIKKFSKFGASWYLCLSKPIMGLLDINPEVDKVDIEINDNVLTIKKA